MTGPRPRSGRGRARHALSTALRLYLSPLGLVVSVGLFLGGAGIRWSIGWLVVWLGVARLYERAGGR